MEAPAERAAPWEITGARHGGITVSDLDRSLAFYRDLLGPELLWRRLYEEPEVHAGSVRFRSTAPVEMASGPNRGGKSLYSLDPDGYSFEFHERPPRVAA